MIDTILFQYINGLAGKIPSSMVFLKAFPMITSPLSPAALSLSGCGSVRGTLPPRYQSAGGSRCRYKYRTDQCACSYQ